MSEELWTEVHNTIWEAVNKSIPEKKRNKKAKQLSERLYKQLKQEEKLKAREKGKGTPI